MKNKQNWRRLILFSLVAGCTMGGLGSVDVYADGNPPYEQILYINENDTVTRIICRDRGNRLQQLA